MDCTEVEELPQLYTPLDYGKTTIRLVRILPDRGDFDRVRCTMETYSLDKRPSYTALSYEWGSKENNHTIEINGCPVLIRENLWHFLQIAMAQQDLIDSLIWVDALCINQVDDVEKSHQVHIMANIFQEAKLVIAWLGRTSDEGSLALESLRRFVLSFNSFGKLAVNGADAILQLCREKYWSRLWVLQELVLAKACVMCAGSGSVPINFLEALLGHASLATSAFAGATGDSEERDKLRDFVESPAGLMLQQRHTGHAETSLLSRVLTCRKLGCENPMDRVYGLLGISQSHGLIPDYSISLSRLCNDLLQKSRAFDSCTYMSDVYAICKGLMKAVGISRDVLFGLEELKTQDHMPTKDELTTFPLVHKQSGISLWWAWAYGHLQVQRLWIFETPDEAREMLQAASSEGHEKVARMLIGAGVDVNAQGGYYGNALQAASSRGHEEVVQMLLEAGADVNAQVGDFDNALYGASSRGHERVVQILLEAGANVNAQERDSDNALYGASSRGHERVVQILLEAGADVNAQGGFFDNALNKASSKGHERVVQILLEAGADVNAQRGDFDNALYGASSRGHERVVQMLLEAGADVNAQGGYYGNALQAASSRGHEKVVQMLLYAGAHRS